LKLKQQPDFTPALGAGVLGRLCRVPEQRGTMSIHLLLVEIEEPVLGVAVAGLNMIISFALVTFSVVLVVTVASVGWLFDRPNKFR
jgi:hypothetical protein